MYFITALRRDEEFKRKIIGTISILLIVRILYSIPTPGVNPEFLESIFQSNTALGFMNILSGSGFSRMTIAAFSVTPFISATIITQLLTICIPKLADLAKQKTRDDEKKMNRLNMFVGCVIALLESFGLAIAFGKQGLLIEYNWVWIVIAGACWTFGAVFTSYIGKFIQEKFIGNGVSLILLMNIVSTLPTDIESLKGIFVDGKHGSDRLMWITIAFGIVFVMFILAYVVQAVVKKVPVTYSMKVSSSAAGKKLNFLPIKLCPGSVMPVIFAGAIFSFPQIILQFVGHSDIEILNYLNTSMWFNPEKPIYSIGAAGYIALIVWFTFFYNNIASNPLEMAEAIEKREGSINNMRPGKETADYIIKETNKMLAVGSIIICIVAMTPMVISGLYGSINVSFLGTSVLIIMGVIIETRKTIKSECIASVERKRLDEGGLL